MPYFYDELYPLIEAGSAVCNPDTGHYHDRDSGIRLMHWREAVGNPDLQFVDKEDLYFEPSPPDDAPAP